MGVILLAIVTACVILCVEACTGNGDEEQKATENIVKEGATVDTALVGRLKDFATKPRPEGKFAFHVYDITADKTVYGCNDTLALPSASCMKLLSGVAGLRLLGTDYHYWTAIFTRGNTTADGTRKGDMRGTVTADGTLNGDIAFRAGLDPQLMAPDLNDFAKAAKKKGIKRISGKLVVDLAITEPVKSEEHWFPWDLTFSKYGLFYKGKERVIKAL